MNCFGSFILQNMFLGLQVFAFEGQNMTFTVKMLFTCILYCEAGPAVIRTVAIAVGRFLSPISYLPSYVFLRRRRSFTSRKLYACLKRLLCFLQLSDRTRVSGTLCIGLLTVLITCLLCAFV